MLMTTKELEQAANRLAPTLARYAMDMSLADQVEAGAVKEPGPFGIEEAREIIAATLGLGTWGETVTTLSKGAPTYPDDWVDGAMTRYYAAESDPKRGGVHFHEMARFNDIFPLRSYVDSKEIEGLSARDAVRLAVSKAAPFRLLTDLDPTSSFADHISTDTHSVGDISYTTTILKFETDPDSRLMNFAWHVSADIAGTKIGHLRGDMYATKRGAQLDIEEALDAADEVSDVDVSNVRALLRLRGYLKGAVATIGDMYVSPAHRGRRVGMGMVLQAIGPLKKAAKKLNEIAIDPSDAHKYLRFPSDFKINGSGPEGGVKAMVVFQFAENFLAPLKQQLHDMGLDLHLAPLADQLQQHQVLSVIGGGFMGRSPLDEIPDEEVLADIISAAQQRIARIFLSGMVPPKP